MTIASEMSCRGLLVQCPTERLRRTREAVIGQSDRGGHTQMSLSDYFRSQADWRRQKAEEYPEDERNAQSAAALDSLAEFVAADEHGDHEAGAVIDRLDAHLFDGITLGGEETQRVVARYGYGYRVTTAQHIEFLDELAALCLVDAYKFASEHGDDPTGTLYDFELEAAADDVMLPQRYFERRSRSTEHELEEAVASYHSDVDS